MSEINKLFGGVLRSARDAKNMTQENLATAIGLSRTAITNIEAGKQGTTIEILYRIAKVLGVEPGDLLPSMGPPDISSVVTDKSNAEKIRKYSS